MGSHHVTDVGFLAGQQDNGNGQPEVMNQITTFVTDVDFVPEQEGGIE